MSENNKKILTPGEFAISQEKPQKILGKTNKYRTSLRRPEDAVEVKRKIEKKLLTRKMEKAKSLMAQGSKKEAADILKRYMPEAKAFKKAGTKLLSGIPILGGALSALTSKDASAAVPVLGDSESLGPEKDSLEAQIENPKLSSEQRAAAMKKLIEKNRMRRIKGE